MWSSAYELSNSLAIGTSCLLTMFGIFYFWQLNPTREQVENEWGIGLVNSSFDILTTEPRGSRPRAGQSTAAGSPLVVGRGAGRASAGSDRDCGLYFPLRGVHLRTLDSSSRPTEADRIKSSPAGGFSPNLQSWAVTSTSVLETETLRLLARS